jgi:magnesium-transporting ATPase (P-type)
MSRLSGPEAQSRLEEYGPNALPEKAAKSFWRERIPADGRLVEAQSVMLAESALRGESVPVSALDLGIDQASASTPPASVITTLAMALASAAQFRASGWESLPKV